VVVVPVRKASAIDLSPHMIWVLALGSDARRGQQVTRSRADAIQLVGINTRTGAATAIGVPRDSWVRIPGRGNDKINSAMVLGGPQLMARAVEGLVGIEPDYVMVTDFTGFRAMIDQIGGVELRSTKAFSDLKLTGGSFRKGNNDVGGWGALSFARIRKPLRGGDFERSAHQQEVLRAIHARLRSQQHRPGFLDQGTLAVLKHVDAQVSPKALFRLTRAVTSVRADRISRCVIGGSVGETSGGASVVFPNRQQARRYGRDAEKDAVLRC
ncbi:MAG TPA: LCP family protein, partial [Nocardioides sp.]